MSSGHTARMKIPILNGHSVRQEFRQQIQSGVPRNELFVFRMNNGHAKVMQINVFTARYGKQYHDLCVELQKRKKRLAKNEILYVWADDNGGYDMGVLDQTPSSKIITTGTGRN